VQIHPTPFSSPRKPLQRPTEPIVLSTLHDETGRIVMPATSLRVHGADPVDTGPSPKLSRHNREIYGDWLGLSTAEIAALEQDGVI
jgi:crotonobetainyl-CoA:carnitine CoA-transferase CaiB-like acyl-CoA transferase